MHNSDEDEIDTGKNLYKAFWRRKEIEVRADTQYEAQTKAALELGAKKSYEVTVMLLSVGGSEVIHSPNEL